MKTAYSFCLALGILACAWCTGCSTVTSQTYTQGAIQSGRLYRPSDNPASAKAMFGTIKVCRFSESRAKYSRERHNLWLVYFPIACIGTFWDRPDWMLWASDKGAYKPAGLDMAEALRDELTESGLFERVLGPQDEGPAEWMIEADIQALKLRTRPHLLGCSILCAPVIGGLGLPLGWWSLEQRVKVRLVSGTGDSCVWEKTVLTRAKGPIAAYYGRYPVQFGYPYEAAMRPVVTEVFAGLLSKCAKPRSTSTSTP